MDLDGDGVAVDAEEGGGGDEAEHEPLLGAVPRERREPERRAVACAGLEALVRD